MGRLSVKENKNVYHLIREELGLETRRHLRKSYIWSKKIRLAIYKLLVYVPKLISGNYKRRIAE